MTLPNQRIPATQAMEIGLITRVVENSALQEAAEEAAEQLAKSATRALGWSRNLLLSSYGNALEEQLELEYRGIAAGGSDGEGSEGIAAFLATRKPNFRGL